MSSAHRVLLVGNGRPHHVGACFERAMRELGHPCRFVDESAFAPEPPWAPAARAILRLPGAARLAGAIFGRVAVATAVTFKPSVVIIVKGGLLTARAVEAIGERSGAVLVNYATDDPFNARASHPRIAASIPRFDLYVTTRKAIIPDLERAGARRIAWVPFGYDPALHFPEQPRDAQEAAAFRSDVAFIGGADTDRASTFAALAARNRADIRLYGGYWSRYPGLRPFARGLVFGREVRLVLGGTRVAPCLVRHANRDGHVMRTFEIPACGGFMLAERTEEHAEFFDEDKHIACFGSKEELADKVSHYLHAESERARLARNAHEHLMTGRHTYRDRLAEILDLVRGAR